MKTPICDFVRSYNELNSMRLHMPGHKGIGLLGCENLDITEIPGADSLYEAGGIIKESEMYASELFGCKTFYSTEGSSQCIRAMLYLTALFAKQEGMRPVVLAARNVHKTFLSAVSLCDIDVEWLYPDDSFSYLTCDISPELLDGTIEKMEEKPVAVYVTSPDYLGNLLDIHGLSLVCRKNGVLLIVDNAHGAYLRFLPKSLHPVTEGAHLCCDSAHKTLPVLTGGAYLHLSSSAPEIFYSKAKDALSLFGSTSPSYLIMQSLDAANKYMSEDYCNKLELFCASVNGLKEKLITNGFTVLDNEPLKITLFAKSYGYTGYEFADILSNNNIVCEFSDPDYVVLMLTPEIGLSGLSVLENVLLNIPKLKPIVRTPPKFALTKKSITIKEAMFSESEIVSVVESLGRVLATPCVSCPPAVPILMPGETIYETHIRAFKYYGIEQIAVVKDKHRAE